MWADGNATVEARPWTSGKTTAPVWQSRGRRIRWRVIWAFFWVYLHWLAGNLGVSWVHFPVTFAVDRLGYKWLSETKDFEAKTASQESEWQGLKPCPLPFVSLKRPWQGQMRWKEICSKTPTKNIWTFRYLPQIFLCWLRAQERVHCQVCKDQKLQM